MPNEKILQARHQRGRLDQAEEDGHLSGRSGGQALQGRVHRAQETLPDKQHLWIGYTETALSESVQSYSIPFGRSMTRSLEQYKLCKEGRRLKDQRLRLAEAAMANRP